MGYDRVNQNPSLRSHVSARSTDMTRSAEMSASGLGRIDRARRRPPGERGPEHPEQDQPHPRDENRARLPRPLGLCRRPGPRPA